LDKSYNLITFIIYLISMIWICKIKLFFNKNKCKYKRTFWRKKTYKSSIKTSQNNSKTKPIFALEKKDFNGKVMKSSDA
jgi:hypothetical protein